MDQVELGAVLYAKLFVGRLFADGKLGIAAKVGKSCFALETFQFLFRSA